jgi:hypothetical protein
LESAFLHLRDPGKLPLLMEKPLGSQFRRLHPNHADDRPSAIRCHIFPGNTNDGFALERTRIGPYAQADKTSSLRCGLDGSSMKLPIEQCIRSVRRWLA